MARGVLRAAAATLLALTVLCGVAYPVVVTATAAGAKALSKS